VLAAVKPLSAGRLDRDSYTDGGKGQL
jgi:hypothetical protein